MKPTQKQQLQQEKAELVKKADALTMKAIEEKRGLTDEEKETETGIDARLDEIDGQIEALDRQSARQARVGTHRNFDISEYDTATKDVTKPAPDITGGKERFEDDPLKGFKRPRDFFAAVMSIGLNGTQSPHYKDKRMAFLAAAGTDEQGEHYGPYGDFFVPEGMMPGVLKRKAEVDFIGGRVQSFPMNVPIVNVNARTDHDHSTSVSGGLVVTRKAHTAEGSLSLMKTEKIAFQATDLFGFAAAEEDLINDSPESIAQLINDGFGDEFATKLLKERLRGTGNGEFLGVTHESNAALITVTAEVGQVAATVVYENIVNMVARCYGYDRAVWAANHTVLPQLAQLAAAVGTGGQLIWNPSAVDGVPSTLMGRPIIFTEHLPALGSANDLIIVDWSQYLEGTLQPLLSAESMHVRFMNHERVFKLWERNDAAPWWRAALTPEFGDTLSPYVALGART